MDRFWSKVRRLGPDECWLWQAGVNGRGYGMFKVGGRNRSAHRVAYELHYGFAPQDEAVRHTCDRKLCCNPAHLLDGTDQENVADAVARGQHPCGERHGRSKLSAQDVLAMREARTNGATYLALAKQYGVVESVAYRAIVGITWKSLSHP